MWRYVYEDFSELDKKDQLALFKAMEQPSLQKCKWCFMVKSNLKERGGKY